MDENLPLCEMECIGKLVTPLALSQDPKVNLLQELMELQLKKKLKVVSSGWSEFLALKREDVEQFESFGKDYIAE